MAGSKERRAAGTPAPAEARRVRRRAREEAAFPDMKGLSPRNLEHTRAFAAAWPERTIVQEALARIPWYHHIALLELGTGLAFVGRQRLLEVGDTGFIVDLRISAGG